jgi:hypothetical protein
MFMNHQTTSQERDTGRRPERLGGVLRNVVAEADGTVLGTAHIIDRQREVGASKEAGLSTKWVSDRAIGDLDEAQKTGIPALSVFTTAPVDFVTTPSGRRRVELRESADALLRRVRMVESFDESRILNQPNRSALPRTGGGPRPNETRSGLCW